jgi:hypothetical protein
MTWPVIFCKPRYNAEQNQMFRLTWGFSPAKQTSFVRRLCLTPLYGVSQNEGKRWLSYIDGRAAGRVSGSEGVKRSTVPCLGN